MKASIFLPLATTPHGWDSNWIGGFPKGYDLYTGYSTSSSGGQWRFIGEVPTPW